MKLQTEISTKQLFEVGGKAVAIFLPEKFSAKDLPADICRHVVLIFYNI